MAKPDRRIFEKALEMAGCTPEDAAMIGDRLDNDIYPAKMLGMKTVWVRQGFAVYQRPEDAAHEPDAIVDHLSQLKGMF